jgi:hypothetical protein
MFIVHLPDKQIKFKKTKQGMYAYKLPIKKTNNEIVQVKTVKKYQIFFTHQQYKRAKRAWELYHSLGTLSIKNFRLMILG